MDSDLRKAQRSGSRLEVLKQRLRAGSLSEEDLRLAALALDEDALTLMGCRCGVTFHRFPDGKIIKCPCGFWSPKAKPEFVDWVDGLPRRGLVQVLVTIFHREQSGFHHWSWRYADAVLEWLMKPRTLLSTQPYREYALVIYGAGYAAYFCASSSDEVIRSNWDEVIHCLDSRHYDACLRSVRRLALGPDQEG